MKIFLISPVRIIDEETKQKIKNYVQYQESKGNTVHWPLRDTNQNDETGYNICMQNAMAMKIADEVHVWFVSNSKGTLFDLGMNWILRKPLILANDITDPGYKSFERLLKVWAQ